MLAEDDLKRYKRDQDQLFDELEEIQRTSQRAIEAEELARAIVQRKLREVQIDELTPQVSKLEQLAGMSELDAVKWAFDLVREAKRLMPDRERG